MSLAYVLLTVLLGALVHRRLLARFGDGPVAHLVRLPGNLLHEMAHAVGFLVTGYTVARLTVSLLDPKGRGGAQPGPAWLPVARPWFTNLVAPVAPVVAGALALAWLQPWGRLPGIPLALPAVGTAIAGVPWDRWEVWVALWLAFAVTAEIAPSDVDFAAWWRPAAVTVGLLAAAAYGVERLWPGTLGVGLPALDEALRPATARALAAAVWSGLVFAPVAWVVGKIRG